MVMIVMMTTIMITKMIMIGPNNKNIDEIIVIIVVSMLVVGPFEKPGLQATFESVR